MTDIIRPFAGFDYVSKENPSISTNPAVIGKTWVNVTTGEIFVCTDATAGANVWVGQLGSVVNQLPRSGLLLEYLSCTGMAILDSSGNTRDIVTSSFVKGSAPIGDGFISDGSTSEAVIPIDLSAISEWAVSFWFFVDEARSYHRFLEVGDWTSTSAMLWFASASTIYLGLGGSTASIESSYAGQWVHVVTNYDGETGTMILNNDESASLGYTETPDSTMTLGSDEESYDGKIAGLRIYNRVLSGAEIAELYQEVVA